MDFGSIGGGDGGMEGFTGHENGGGGAASLLVQAPETKGKTVGSGLAKQERSAGSGQDEWRSLKMLRTDDFSVPKAMPLHQANPLLRSNSAVSGGEHMLSFSLLKPDATPFVRKDGGLVDRSSQGQSGLFPYYQQKPTAYPGSVSVAGYSTGNLNASMHGPFTGVRGPFTPSQWMELEHQALIYKYLTANVPVPSNLLIPLKRSPLYPYNLPGSATGSFPNSLHTVGWGTFQLGYPGNNTDPEPGRCRRTDGKKWRCSRDAVPDQKYCERHINRGRHRSRKPVEGQNGHATTGTTDSKVAPMTSSMSTSVITSGGASNSLAITQQQQLKNFQLPGAGCSSADALTNRFSLSKENVTGRAQDPRGLPMMSSTMNIKPEESAFAISKQDIVTEESSQSEFGLVSSDSLLNPSQRSSFMNSKSYDTFLTFNDQENQDQYPLHRFIDDWPKNQSSRSVISWPEELKSDWTQLSMSIPVASSGFSSSSSSPTQEKLATSPLRLSHEFDPIQMGMGAGAELCNSTQKQTNWIPVSWGTSIGGPLGEVLTSSTGNGGSCKSSSVLNLMTEGWDCSPQLGSSPTGVLQKATFTSFSNSSSGSSSRTESKKNNDSASLCYDVLASTIASPSLIPSL